VPVSTENEAVLKGRVAPKKKKTASQDEEEKDDGKAVKQEDI